MDRGNWPSASDQTDPEIQLLRAMQSEPVDDPGRSLEEFDRRLDQLFLAELEGDTKSFYPTRRLKAQRLYNFVVAKIETDRLPIRAAKAVVDERVRQEEKKLIKDFTACKALSLFPAHSSSQSRNENTREASR